jgi:hypothetical protein
MVFFIPWRVVAENPARRISTCSGRLGGAAAADDVADFFSVIFRIRQLSALISPNQPIFSTASLPKPDA